MRHTLFWETAAWMNNVHTATKQHKDNQHADTEPTRVEHGDLNGDEILVRKEKLLPVH